MDGTDGTRQERQEPEGRGQRGEEGGQTHLSERTSHGVFMRGVRASLVVVARQHVHHVGNAHHK